MEILLLFRKSACIFHLLSKCLVISSGHVHAWACYISTSTCSIKILKFTVINWRLQHNQCVWAISKWWKLVEETKGKKKQNLSKGNKVNSTSSWYYFKVRVSKLFWVNTYSCINRPVIFVLLTMHHKATFKWNIRATVDL